MADKTINLDAPNQWSQAAVQALIERLYETRRRAEAMGIKSPVFVLPCRNDKARQELEEAIYRYYILKYGVGSTATQVKDSFYAGGDSLMHFDFGVTLALMNV